MKKICVTGANGFIGKNLCIALSLANYKVRGFVRDKYLLKKSSKIEYVSVGDLNKKINWENHLFGFDVIIHCAAKVHSMHNKTKLNDYFLVNVEGTRQLAEQAAKAGIKRFIFLSSIKVNGEISDEKHKLKIFTNSDVPNPQDAYSDSKFKAEKVLWEISSKTGLEVVVVRLPLVYGYGVKGNMEKLIKLVKLGMPLPLSNIKNKRSLIGIDNLITILLCCIINSNANGKTFLVSDGNDLSTPDLLKYIATALDIRLRLFPFPIFLLKFFSYFLGKSSEINRLTGNLQVDIDDTRKTLNCSSPISVEKGIKKMVNGE